MNVNSLNLKLRAKWTQQLPTLLGHEVHGGKDIIIKYSNNNIIKQIKLCKLQGDHV